MIRRMIVRTLGTMLLTLTVFAATPGYAIAQLAAQPQQQTVIRRPLARGAFNRALDFVRTELFFGTAKPDGVVSDEEFLAFIDQEVTPRFPAGLTLLKGDGQFEGGDGQIVKEDSFLLILLYPLEDFRESSRSINAIRRLYKEQFQQESVLRVDDPFAVRVSF